MQTQAGWGAQSLGDAVGIFHRDWGMRSQSRGRRVAFHSRGFLPTGVGYGCAYKGQASVVQASLCSASVCSIFFSCFFVCDEKLLQKCVRVVKVCVFVNRGVLLDVWHGVLCVGIPPSFACEFDNWLIL